MIEHYETADFSPAWPLVAAAVNELSQKGWINGSPVNWDDKVIALKDEDTILGIMCYRKTNYDNALWISLSYVPPEHRGKGYYRKLYSALQTKAKELKARFITSSVHVKNNNMRVVARTMGRTEHSIEFRDEVK